MTPGTHHLVHALREMTSQLSWQVVGLVVVGLLLLLEFLFVLLMIVSTI